MEKSGMSKSRRASTSRRNAAGVRLAEPVQPTRSRRPGRPAALADLVSRYVDDLVSAINSHLRKNMASQVREFIARNGRTLVVAGRRASTRAKRLLPCIAPGCTNASKGPRFHYLCEKHREAPKKDYEAWRLQARKKRAA
jgi:hypothetical protein